MQAAHGHIGKKQVGQRHEAGKGREEEYDKRILFPSETQASDGCVSGACGKSSEEADDGGQSLLKLEAGPDDEHAPHEGGCHRACLK